MDNGKPNNRPTTPTIQTHGMNTSTPVSARSSGLMGAIVGKLKGLHKNPIKHVSMDLVDAISKSKDSKLPNIIELGEETLKFAKGKNVPINDRNPYFISILTAFLPLAKHLVRVGKGGTISEEEAKSGYISLSGFTKRTHKDRMHIDYSYGSEHRKSQTNQIMDNTNKAVVRGIIFYRGILSPYAEKRKVEKAEASRKASKAMTNALQEKLNALSKPRNIKTLKGGKKGLRVKHTKRSVKYRSVSNLVGLKGN
jgi:hypothetical protein